jgi:predicted nucleic acid-binding protein
MSRFLLDLNVVLDLFLARLPWSTEAAEIWKANHEGRIVAYFASVSVPTLFYVMPKQVGLPLAQKAVADCLGSLTITSVSLSTLRIAATGPGSDFEDNLQIASAMEAGVDAIITRDPKGFVGSPVLIYSPVEVLARI